MHMHYVSEECKISVLASQKFLVKCPKKGIYESTKIAGGKVK